MRTQKVSGSVAAVGSNDLTIRSADRGDVKLELSTSTAVDLDGRPAPRPYWHSSR
jgi:hypothetical protein